jgi:hypothetical protein
MNTQTKNNLIECVFLFLMLLVGFGMGHVACWMKAGVIG